MAFNLVDVHALKLPFHPESSIDVATALAEPVAPGVWFGQLQFSERQ